MSAADCPFCQHANPPDSKFCNACGAPLYLAPCPNCGAVNDATATACHRCAGRLVTPGGPLPAGPLRGSGDLGADVPPPGIEALLAKSPTNEWRERDAQLSATLEEIRQFLNRTEPGVAPKTAEGPGAPVPPRALSVPEAPEPPRVSGPSKAARPPPVVAKPDVLPAYPTSVVAEPRAVRGELYRTRDRRSTVLVGIAAAGLVAGAVYYGYRSSTSEAPPSAGTAKSSDAGPIKGSNPGATETPAGGSTAAPATPSRTGSITAPTPAVVAVPTPAGQVPSVRPGTVTPGDVGQPATAPPPGPAGVSERRDAAEAKAAPASTAAAAAPAPRPRTVETGAGFGLQQPRIGPCTEAVAALGLCTREPAQKKE